MRKTTAALLVIYITNIFSTCEKVVREPDKYAFDMSAAFSPDIDSIKLKDTLTLEIKCATTQIDKNTGQLIDFNNAHNLSTSIYFDKLVFDTVRQSSLTLASNKFSAIVVNGSVKESPDPPRIKQFLFEELNGNYILKLKFIPLDTGLYSITLEDLPLIYRNSDRNTKATYFVTIANTEQHLYHMENYLPDLVIDDNLSRHLYCFKVY